MLKCTLCGGALQMNAGGQDASCPACGLKYPMARLREMLSAQPVKPAQPVQPVRPVQPPQPVQNEVIYDVTQWSPVNGTASGGTQPVRPVFVPQPPKQFIMQVQSGSRGDLIGYVQQGTIGSGDTIYLDQDYTRPYKVCSAEINGTFCRWATAGDQVLLIIEGCPHKIIKHAQLATGVPRPMENGYNFPGSVPEYVSSLLGRVFPEYEQRMNVSHPALRIPVSLMLYRSGRPVLALMLVSSNDSRARYQAQKAVRVFAAEGIRSTHLFTDYRNDAPYVICRVRSALGT